ncbi:hypothetical protein PHO31112_03246 [Pandoraea horticolens]|uniref:YqcI/YcgG family protein n=1 Tax=Pandoraea horticolens TaxID=2508298 RepID=A0A5E4WFS6_9BURK|nr:hypothetical protein PHO31112_03246 [Pandoraea horticolens]
MQLDPPDTLGSTRFTDPIESSPAPKRVTASDWRSRVILGDQVGGIELPDWLETSYKTLRTQVMHPEYPCFFGTIAERRCEMFYSFVNGKDNATLPATMLTFTRLASQPEFRRNNIAIFYEPDATPLTHTEYHDLFWGTLQHLHNVDPDPEADHQVPPSHEDWEFGYGGLQMFVVCACPSFSQRHSRNLGPGMVLLFQPRAVFVDTITNKVIGRQAREQVRERLRKWDAVGPHPDLGFYGDPGNLEWKQYFLEDANIAAADQCPFLKRMRRVTEDATALSVPADTQPPTPMLGKIPVHLKPHPTEGPSISHVAHVGHAGHLSRQMHAEAGHGRLIEQGDASPREMPSGHSQHSGSHAPAPSRNDGEHLE